MIDGLQKFSKVSVLVHLLYKTAIETNSITYATTDTNTTQKNTTNTTKKNTGTITYATTVHAPKVNTLIAVT